MKAAMMGFLEQHGSKPEAAAILPEIIRNAAMLPPSERNSITEFTNQSFSSIAGFSRPGQVAPGFGPNKQQKPQFSVLKLKQAAPLTGANGRFEMDHFASMRNEVLRVNESVIQAGKLPPPKNAEVHNINRESFKPVLGAQKSHAILSSLIDRVRSHGMNESVHTFKAKPAKRSKSRAKARTKARVRPSRRLKRGPWQG